MLVLGTALIVLSFLVGAIVVYQLIISPNNYIFTVTYYALSWALFAIGTWLVGLGAKEKMKVKENGNR